MNGYEKTTRATKTTTHTLNLGQRTTLDDLRQLVEATAHLGAGTPVQRDMLGFVLEVHEVRLDEEATP